MGKQWKQWETLFSWAPKSLHMVTTAKKLKDACSLEESYDNLDSILKIRDITLLTKVCLVKTMVFPLVMYGCESWTIKKAEHQRIDTLESWCWRIFFRVPWRAGISNQLILKEINPEYSLEGLMLKLKLQYFGHLLWRANSLEKTDAGRDCRQEEKGETENEMVGWHHRLNGHEFEQTLGDSEGQGSLVCCSPWDRKESDTTDWRTLIYEKIDSEKDKIHKADKSWGWIQSRVYLTPNGFPGFEDIHWWVTPDRCLQGRWGAFSSEPPSNLKPSHLSLNNNYKPTNF